MTNKTEKEARCKEFLQTLGSGKTIYQCEAENDRIDELVEKENE